VLTARRHKLDWVRLAERVKPTCIKAVVTFGFAAVAWAFLNGPRLYAEAEFQTAVEVEAENRDVCRRLGTPSGNDPYPACASELDWVRRQHERRVLAREAGFP
jgi:hypothetical protein